ncbi:hypothetical protein HDU79_006580 [Rhizoclosmatium sp. JEL0117]|nr:hypothetical protein HDU79_006580 [Rhizoclosmatium sp. JEL0117]
MRAPIISRSFIAAITALSVIGLLVLSLRVGLWSPSDSNHQNTYDDPDHSLVQLPKDTTFDQCCAVNRSITFPQQSPPFSICLHPRGADIHVSDSVYNSKGDGDHTFESGIRKEMLKLLQENGDPDAIMLDIGANIGLHSLFIANAGYKVHSFEPMTANYNLLRCSAISNDVLKKNLVLNNFGLGNVVSTSCISAEAGNYGSARIQNATTAVCPPENTVRVRRLDEYLNKHKIKPFLIKIDVEGFEFKALSPAKEYFRKHPPAHIFSEFYTAHFVATGTDPKEYLQFFYDLGYKISFYNSFDVQKGDAAYTQLLNGNFYDLHMTRI